MNFDEKTVAGSLDGLTFHKNLVKRVLSDDSRVPKYRHDVTEAFGLNDRDHAALCVLMLRGPQTLGEIRGRSERLYPFENLGEVEDSLQAMITRETPLVVQLSRRMGHKEARYAHLLAGEVNEEDTEPLEPAVLEIRADNTRIDSLEEEVRSLKETVQELQSQFSEFKKQFE